MGVDIVVYLFDSRPYENLVLPAYKAFLEKSDTAPLAELLETLLPTLVMVGSSRGAPAWSRSIYEDDIEILRGRKFYSSSGKKGKKGSVTVPEDMRVFVNTQVAPDLVQLLCFPQDQGLNPKQSMSQTALDNYLYGHSSWIEDYFTGSKQVSGPVPQIKIGEWSQFFSREEVEVFDRELSRMPRPTDSQALEDGFDNLRALVHAAATKDPNLRLLYVIL